MEPARKIFSAPVSSGLIAAPNSISGAMLPLIATLPSVVG